MTFSEFMHALGYEAEADHKGRYVVTDRMGNVYLGENQEKMAMEAFEREAKKLYDTARFGLGARECVRIIGINPFYGIPDNPKAFAKAFLGIKPRYPEKFAQWLPLSNVFQTAANGWELDFEDAIPGMTGTILCLMEEGLLCVSMLQENDKVAITFSATECGLKEFFRIVLPGNLREEEDSLRLRGAGRLAIKLKELSKDKVRARETAWIMTLAKKTGHVFYDPFLRKTVEECVSAEKGRFYVKTRPRLEEFEYER